MHLAVGANEPGVCHKVFVSSRGASLMGKATFSGQQLEECPKAWEYSLAHSQLVCPKPKPLSSEVTEEN